MRGSSLFSCLACGDAELAEHHPYSILEQSKAQERPEGSKVPPVRMKPTISIAVAVPALP